MRIVPYFPDLGSIVIPFVFLDYETVAGRKVSVKSLARTRNCCYIFCIYFRRHFDKTSRCVPIKFAWMVDLSMKREREREREFFCDRSFTRRRSSLLRSVSSNRAESNVRFRSFAGLSSSMLRRLLRLKVVSSSAAVYLARSRGPT